jgi:hypothetical protein
MSAQFNFCGRVLRISTPKPNGQQRSNKKPTTQVVENRSNAIDLKITGIYYGTLITRAAMTNIDKEDNITDDKRLGIIANELTISGYNLPSRFIIDEQSRKFAIVIANNSMIDPTIAVGASIDLLFEWSFRE